MKNRESRRSSKTNVDYDLVKKKLNQGNLQAQHEEVKTQKKGPTKSQINRLKKFYNTTRWLPNSAFTTYFGKPAFENYGYGNTNPVYGGLFYGNYMLSHNMNPIDGANHPPEKQVYSSAMMKSCQRKGIRKPSPPRKVPDEIRNTPEELMEIKTRAQIFQLPNNFPSRDIIPPNLLKARYFRSGKNTPNDSLDEGEDEDEYEVWNVENVLSGKKNKTKKIDKANKGGQKFNPYQQGKVQLSKKKMKEGLDNKINEDLYKKVRDKKNKKKGEEEQEQEEEKDNEVDESEEEFERQKNFYEKMLGEEGMKNLEDLKDIKIEDKEEEKEEEKKEEEKNEEEPNQNETAENTCPYCNNTIMKTMTSPNNTMSRLKKKENPALLPPSEVFPGFVCCMHHSKEQFNMKEKDPRTYTNMPPCMMNTITPAGLPMKKSKPLNLFE